jgi:hypothetical protein
MLHPVRPGAVVASIARIDDGAVESRTHWLVGRALDVGGGLHVGETFAASGAALIRLDHGGTFRVAPDTRFKITGPDELLLHSGRTYFDFPLGAHAFVVRSAIGTVEHLGTQFEVALGTGGMRVRVREGVGHLHVGPYEIGAVNDVDPGCAFRSASCCASDSCAARTVQELLRSAT